MDASIYWYVPMLIIADPVGLAGLPELASEGSRSGPEQSFVVVLQPGHNRINGDVCIITI